jgi:RHS repeat-associated protein
VSDEAGRLHEEIAYYPFGQIRNRYLATEGAPAVEHDFTGKETDTESGLTQLGARSYDAVLGRFASVDPRLGNPAVLNADQLDALLSDPQNLGSYTYGSNHPLGRFYLDGPRSAITPSRRGPASAALRGRRRP